MCLQQLVFWFGVCLLLVFFEVHLTFKKYQVTRCPSVWVLQILPHQPGHRFLSCNESRTRIPQACADLTELLPPGRTNQWFRASSPGHHFELSKRGCRHYHLTAFWQADSLQHELMDSVHSKEVLIF